MRFERIQISNVRVIERVDVKLDPGINVLIGKNGSGKTSFLEAIHFVAKGRSFLTNRVRPLIRSDAQEATVFGELIDEAGGVCRIGVRRGARGDLIRRKDGNRVSSWAEMAITVPFQTLTPSDDGPIDGGPSARRSFIDGLLFHVEPVFFDTWYHYHKTLKQRNAQLRAKITRGLSEWSAILAESGERLSQLRSVEVSRFSEYSHDFLTRFVGYAVELAYDPGFSLDASFADALAHSATADMKLGTTTSGPHRADMVIRMTNTSFDQMSRGQKKLLIIGLLLAQSAYIEFRTGRKSVFLFDDLTAELDEESKERVIAEIHSRGNQAIITSLEKIVTFRPTTFHVERGVITPLSS